MEISGEAFLLNSFRNGINGNWEDVFVSGKDCDRKDNSLVFQETWKSKGEKK